MEILILAATFSITATIVWALLGCLSCREKPPDEEVQRKYFEKFKKRHMLPKDRGLGTGVDVIRATGTDAEQKARTESVVSTLADHTYEDVISFERRKSIDADSMREHSFFDESFDTVVEASSSSAASQQSSCHNNKVTMQHLGVHNNMASYLSLRPDSRSCLFTGSSGQLSGGSQCCGEVNSAFSEASLANSDDRQLTRPPHNDTYLVPQMVPAIRVTQPSLLKPQCHFQQPPKTSAKDTTQKLNIFVCDESHGGKESHHSVFSAEQKIQNDDWHSKNLQNIFIYDKIQGAVQKKTKFNDDLHSKTLRKLFMEGPTSDTEARRLSYDSAQTLYEKIKESRIENNSFKSLNSLVMPPRRSYLPRSSTQSDHTYESITAELSGEMLRADDIDNIDCAMPGPFSAFEDVHCFDTPFVDCRRKSVPHDEMNDLNKSSDHTYECAPDHTYESLGCRFSQSTTGPGSPDLAVVIIGKRKNGLYDSVRSNNFHERKPRDGLSDTKDNLELKKSWNDTVDRYSPFPSSKKLAIKSSFRPIVSAKTHNLDLATEQHTPFRIPEGLGNMGQSCRRFSIENREMFTPEITVENTPTVFYSPKKQYFQHASLSVPVENGQEGISPMCTYKTLKACANLKMKDLNSKGKRHSLTLPSISMNLEEDLRSHCDLNEYQSSTPFFDI